MSLRSFAEQLRHEDRQDAEFEASLGDALGPFNTMTPTEVAEWANCDQHDRGEAKTCGWSNIDGGWNCLARRIKAARAKARVVAAYGSETL